MQAEGAAAIEKVTAKTIFEENVFYMVTWRRPHEAQSTWKPSEFFEAAPELRALVERFEAEMKRTEEDLFRKLERAEGARKSRRERRPRPAEPGLRRGGAKAQRRKMQFTPKEQRELFKKFDPRLLGSVQRGGLRGAGEAMRRRKLAVFYELELREKVFDFRNYGRKVLADLRKIGDPRRERRLLGVRHAELARNLRVEE